MTARSGCWPARIRAFLAVCVVAGHLAWSWPSHERSASAQIGLGELLPAYRAGRITLVDGREPAEYRAGHIAGAVQLSSNPALAGRIVVVYCSNAGCNNSAMVARQVKDAGAASVRIYREGFKEWVAGGLPIEVGP